MGIVFHPFVHYAVAIPKKWNIFFELEFHQSFFLLILAAYQIDPTVSEATIVIVGVVELLWFVDRVLRRWFTRIYGS